MFNEIVFFIQTPLTRRDYERFGVGTLQKRGFKVTFLDMTKLLNPEYLKNYQPSDMFPYGNIIIPRTQADIMNYFSKEQEVFCIDLIGARPDNLFFYQILKRFNVKYASFCTNSLPEPLWSNRGWLDKFKKVNPTKIFKKIQSLLFSKTNQLQPPAFILAGGRRYTKKQPKPDRKTKIIWAHSLDYDLYLRFKLQKSEPLIKEDYAVFLDEYFPFHPDFLINGNPTISLNPDKYYTGLNRFFNYMGDKLVLPVIIAAHPRSRYDLKPDYFRGHKLEKGKIVELISRSKYVLAHSSTAINFAVMYRKPIIFLTSDEIERTYYGSFISNFAAQFNKNPINVDHEEEYAIEGEFRIDENKHFEYFCNYIKIPGTPEKPFWDIMADAIIEKGGLS